METSEKRTLQDQPFCPLQFFFFGGQECINDNKTVSIWDLKCPLSRDCPLFGESSIRGSIAVFSHSSSHGDCDVPLLHALDFTLLVCQHQQNTTHPLPASKWRTQHRHYISSGTKFQSTSGYGLSTLITIRVGGGGSG